MQPAKMKGEELRARLRYLYVPFLLLGVGVAVCYTALDWVLTIKTDLLVLDEQVAGFLLPLGFAFLAFFLTFRTRLKALNLEAPVGNLPGLYYLVATLGIAVPTMVAHAYLSDVTDAVIRVKRAQDIDTYAKYYVADQVCIDKSLAVTVERRRLTGRLKIWLSFSQFNVVPVCGPYGHSGPNVWLGFLHDKVVPDWEPDSQKEIDHREFLAEATDAFQTVDPRSFTYLEQAGRNQYRLGYEAALREAGKSWEFILVPHTEPFEFRNRATLSGIFGTFAIGAAFWLFMVLVPPIDRTRSHEMKLPEGSLRSSSE